MEKHFKAYYLNQCTSLIVVSDSVTPWTAACQASLSIHQLLELTQTHVLHQCTLLFPKNTEGLDWW